LDIETVPEAADFNELDAEMKDLWEHKPNTSEKTNILLKSSMTERGFGLGKIVCISVGYFVSKGDIRNSGLLFFERKLKF
jgi:hypothetical protein